MAYICFTIFTFNASYLKYLTGIKAGLRQFYDLLNTAEFWRLNSGHRHDICLRPVLKLNRPDIRHARDLNWAFQLHLTQLPQNMMQLKLHNAPKCSTVMTTMSWLNMLSPSHIRGPTAGKELVMCQAMSTWHVPNVNMVTELDFQLNVKMKNLLDVMGEGQVTIIGIKSNHSRSKTW